MKLLPCPFCGCVEILIGRGGGQSFAECQNCGAEAGHSSDAKSATKFWNERVQGEVVEKEVEES